MIRLKEFNTGDIIIPHDVLGSIKHARKEGEDVEIVIADQYGITKDQSQQLIGTVDEANAYMKQFEGGKFTLAGKPFIEGTTISPAYCVAGELLIESIEDASKSLRSPVTITGEYLIGHSWAGAH